MYPVVMVKQIAIDAELHERLKAVTQAKGFKLRGLTERLIREWLRNVDAGPKRRVGRERPAPAVTPR